MDYFFPEPKQIRIQLDNNKDAPIIRPASHLEEPKSIKISVSNVKSKVPVIRPATNLADADARFRSIDDVPVIRPATNLEDFNIPVIRPATNVNIME